MDNNKLLQTVAILAIMRFTKAFTRKPGPTYKNCISSHPQHHLLDYKKALKQHDSYQKLLSELGLEIIEIPMSQSFPDACFVEDNSVIYGNKLLRTHMGAESRRGESTQYLNLLAEHFTVIDMENSGTLEGGDVIHVPDYNLLISGVTERTNLEGTKIMSEQLGIRVEVIEDQSIVHLKSYMSYLGEGIMIATDKYKDHPILQANKFEIVIVPPTESYAANALVINGTVVLPHNSDGLKQLLKEKGFDVELLEVSEFAKCEGALTCLSVIF